MKKLTLRNKLYICLLLGCFLISFLLDYFVFKKSAPNFPVILRTNDFGTNFLANRYAIWQIPVLGIILISINFLLSRLFRAKRETRFWTEANRFLFQNTKKNLNQVLFFVNIGVAILIFLISLQIYILNR